MGWTEPRISDATIAEVERILEQEAIDYPLSLKLEFQRIFNAIARTALPDAIREIKRLRELAEAALAALRQEPTDAA